jgi:hypothetical protein
MSSSIRRAAAGTSGSARTATSPRGNCSGCGTSRHARLLACKPSIGNHPNCSCHSTAGRIGADPELAAVTLASVTADGGAAAGYAPPDGHLAAPPGRLIPLGRGLPAFACKFAANRVMTTGAPRAPDSCASLWWISDQRVQPSVNARRTPWPPPGVFAPEPAPGRADAMRRLDGLASVVRAEAVPIVGATNPAARSW